MLEKIVHYITGYVKMSVDGDSGRFFTVAAKSGLRMWGFESKNKRSYACIRSREYSRLRPIKTRCGVRLKIVKKRGLPFYTSRLVKRPGLIAGIFIFIAAYWFLSGFVWGVNVSGDETITQRAILAAAKKYGVYEGAAIKEIDPKAAAIGIMKDVEGLSWVSVNTGDCFVTVEIKESIKKPDIINDTIISDIVASRPGKIVAIEAQSGRPMVDIGDMALENDVLIAGIYQEERRDDDYSERPLITIEGAARGSVRAQTYREFIVEVPLIKTIRKDTGKIQVNRNLVFLGIRFPLGINTIPDDPHRLSKSRSELSVLDITLPLRIERDIYSFYTTQAVTLNQEDAKEEARIKLREFQNTQLPENSKILHEELSYTFTESSCILTSRNRIEEEIGITIEK